ncbi:MAG: hypothetical protein WBA23_13860 [Tunicatimonas sp.]|uniref:hypothetical protein n=1 Tax=Tunicatimonas sp. TaxID=1940096 RepID=UPI003C75DBAB
MVVESKGFQGVIFSEDTDCTYCFKSEKRFSPTLHNIQEAEEVLKNNLRQENRERVNQGKNCPVIHKNLNNYRRQYFGYINQEGDSIIYTIFEWDRYSISDRMRGLSKNESEHWKKEMVMVFDGCSYYWVVNINITEQSLFGLRTNGSA